MTISSTANKAICYGNGVATSFPYGFLIPNQSQLSVLLTDPSGNITTLSPSQYAASGIGNKSGGAITYPLSGAPLASGWSITVLRTLPIVQQTDIVNQDGFYPDVMESAMDYQTMTQQQLAEAQSRALSFPVVDDQTAITPLLPAAAARALKPLIFDGSGGVTTGQQAYIEPQTLLDLAKAVAELLVAGVSPGAGTGTFLADGASAVVRTFQDKMRDDLSVDDFTTFIAACNASIQKGRYVRLPGRNFNLPADTVIPPGADVRGVRGQTTITISGDNTSDLLICGGGNISLRSIGLIGGRYALNLNGNSRCVVDRCTVTGTAQHGIYCDGAQNKFYDNDLSGCGLTGIALVGAAAQFNRVIDNDGGSNGSFVVWVSGGANRNILHGNKTFGGNAAELIGVTYDSHDNRIIANHAEGTLDNGISVTGYRNIVKGNFCIGNANHGIGIYGERNTVTGNTCTNNGQANLTAGKLPYAGIAMTPAFGGLARKNIVYNNVCDDNQAVKTQQYGIKVTTNSHIQWTAGMTVGAATAFCFNGLFIYHTTDVETAGTIPPTHTSGTASDGNINWTVVASNRFSLADTPTYWSAGLVVVANTYVRYLNNTYVSAAAGTTGGAGPTHLSGTVSDGGVQWTFVEQYPNNLDGWDNEIGVNQANGNALGEWVVLTSNAQRIKQSGIIRNSVDGRQITADMLTIAQYPEGALTAATGSIAQRTDSSVAPGIALFSKQSGSSNTGWLPVALRHQGLSANRPALGALGLGVRGYQYFATDIGTQGTWITWQGTQWFDPISGNTYPDV